MYKSALLIDDQVKKVEAISSLLYSILPDLKIWPASNFRQAQNNLLNADTLELDLIILDMSFEVHASISEDPTFAGLAGLHVLQFLRRARIDLPVVIITSHYNFSDPEFGTIDGIDNLKGHISATFDQNILGVIHMSVNEAVWHAEFKEAIGDQSWE